MHRYYEKITGWFDFPEFYDFIVNHFDNALFVELGTWQGKSLMYLAEKIKEKRKNIKIIGIDTFCGTSPAMLEESGMTSEQLFEKYIENIKPLQEYILTMKGSTHELYKFFGDGSIDFLFIDAAHSYAS